MRPSVSNNKFNRYELSRFRHATMAIADNIGFASANSSALSSLSFLLRTYFEQLCRDSLDSAINSRRSEVSLEDVSHVFGVNGINLTELHGYIHQVAPFAFAEEHPLFPVIEPMIVLSTEIANSEERKDDERENAGNDGTEVDEEGGREQNNKQVMNSSSSRSNARSAIFQKIFPNFAGAFAPSLGFTVQKVELPVENIFVDQQLVNMRPSSSETAVHTMFEFDHSIAQPIRTKAAISEEEERLLKKKKKKEKREKEKRMAEETEEKTGNDGKRKKHKMKDNSADRGPDEESLLLQLPLLPDKQQQPASISPPQEPLKIPKLKIRIPITQRLSPVGHPPIASIAQENLLISRHTTEPLVPKIIAATLTTITTTPTMTTNVLSKTTAETIKPSVETIKAAKEVTTIPKGLTKTPKEMTKTPKVMMRKTPKEVTPKEATKTPKEATKTPKEMTKLSNEMTKTATETTTTTAASKTVDAPNPVTTAIVPMTMSTVATTPITTTASIPSAVKQQPTAPFAVTSSGRSVKPSKRKFEESETENPMAKGSAKPKTAPKALKISSTPKLPKRPIFPAIDRVNNSAAKVEAIAKAVEQIAAAQFSSASLGTVDNAGGANEEEEEPIWICPTCSVAYVEGQEMVACDDCDRWYHWGCVGILIPPPERAQWYCTECRRKRKKSQQQSSTDGGGGSGPNSRKSSLTGAAPLAVTAKKQRVTKT
ncbi:transcription initiation factor TFIID subunit 3 [Globodera pallida]|nr:transcription initiation factor TFIID subunit 3 [Globodera pallida]